MRVRCYEKVIREAIDPATVTREMSAMAGAYYAYLNQTATDLDEINAARFALADALEEAGCQHESWLKALKGKAIFSSTGFNAVYLLWISMHNTDKSHSSDLTDHWMTRVAWTQSYDIPNEMKEAHLLASRPFCTQMKDDAVRLYKEGDRVGAYWARERAKIVTGATHGAFVSAEVRRSSIWSGPTPAPGHINIRPAHKKFSRDLRRGRPLTYEELTAMVKL